MPARCSAFTTPLNSCTCSPRVPGRRVLVVRREVADRVVAPVVAQAALEEQRVLHELVHRQQLDRGDAQLLQVLDRRRDWRGRRTCPRTCSGRLGLPLREPLDVRLVDDRLVPRRPRRRVALPVEAPDRPPPTSACRARCRGRSSSRRDCRSDTGTSPRATSHAAVDRLGVWIQQQLVGIAPVPLVRAPRGRARGSRSAGPA